MHSPSEHTFSLFPLYQAIPSIDAIFVYPVTFAPPVASNEWQAVHYGRANYECTAGNPLAVAEECTPEKFS